MANQTELVTTHSGPRTPVELMQRFGEFVARRELDTLVALYESEAVFVPQPGVIHTGLKAIAGALGNMLGLAPVMSTVVKEVHTVDNISLVIVDWTMRGTAPDGSEVTQSGTSADVLRRQTDGTWRVLIDHP